VDVDAGSKRQRARVEAVRSLLDWKRRVLDLYRAAREEAVPERGWLLWREGRDALFRDHPQSPLPPSERAGFPGLGYFPYDPGLRVLAAVEPATHARVEFGASTGAPFVFERFGRARFPLDGNSASLDLYWLEGYGGGLFLPFTDSTSGAETYGAGRYLLDTVKGADLGWNDGRLLLDLNFAYNPSCAYDPRWACPLAPPGNRLAVPVRGGERVYES
jgi:uncharacterized protein (DUF1684 family)